MPGAGDRATCVLEVVVKQSHKTLLLWSLLIVMFVPETVTWLPNKLFP